MGRNRKGRQCGGYASKMEKFMLVKRWQQEAARVATQNQKARQAHHKYAQLNGASNHKDAAASALKRRVLRVDVVKALMQARLKDDKVELIKLKSVESITTELHKASTIDKCMTLQERCLYEIARTFDCYSSSCPYTEEFFRHFEPWMITRLAELSTAFKTINDGNVSLLLHQPTDKLTLGFVRDEKALALLFDKSEHDPQRLMWQFDRFMQHEVESWDELDVDEVDVVQSHDEVQLQSLRLVSCTGLSGQFLTRLTTDHPFLERLEIIDCFDMAASEEGSALLKQIANLRSLKTIRFSWCCWLTTEILVTFAYQLLETPLSKLQELAISDCFDVVEDYVRAHFQELHPRLRVTF